jgi:hypothetical protein
MDGERAAGSGGGPSGHLPDQGPRIEGILSVAGPLRRVVPARPRAGTAGCARWYPPPLPPPSEMALRWLLGICLWRGKGGFGKTETAARSSAGCHPGRWSKPSGSGLDGFRGRLNQSRFGSSSGIHFLIASYGGSIGSMVWFARPAWRAHPSGFGFACVQNASGPSAFFSGGMEEAGEDSPVIGEEFVPAVVNELPEGRGGGGCGAGRWTTQRVFNRTFIVRARTGVMDRFVRPS